MTDDCDDREAAERWEMGEDERKAEIEAMEAEISRLKAELDEAKERVEELMHHAHSGIAPHYSGSFDRAEKDPVLVRARAFLNKAGK